MSITFKIRTVNKNDLPALQELYLNLHEEQVTPLTGEVMQVWADILADPNYHIFVGEDKGEILSSVTLIIIPNLTRGFRPYAVIENVVTAESHRNHGYASLLLAHAVGVAKERGCYKVMLMTGSKSESTLRLYRRAGFSDTEKTAFVMRM